jgi:hypothetical protein
MDKANILTRIKELFSTQEDYKFMDYKTMDGRILRCESDGLDVGSKITEITQDGEVPVEDGEYTLEDGMVLTIAGGMVDRMTESEDSIGEEDMKVEEVMNEVSTQEFSETTLLDGTKVRIDGDLAVGNKVEVEIDGEYVKAPEGQHNLADGRVIYVDADGMINEIQTPDTKKVDEVGMEEVFSSLELLLEKINSLTNELTSVKNENESLKSRIDMFAKAPSAEPINQKINLIKNSKEDKLKFFANR